MPAKDWAEAEARQVFESLNPEEQTAGFFGTWSDDPNRCWIRSTSGAVVSAIAFALRAAESRGYERGRNELAQEAITYVATQVQLRKMTETVRMLAPLDAVNTQRSPAQSEGGVT